MPNVNISMTGRSAGEEISSTYEGRHITVLESALTHPSHTDGFVDKGDPVILNDLLIGVALESASAATDYIAIDTEGIWALTVSGTDAVGNSAVAAGDPVYINKSTCALSKDSDKNTNQRFGIALSPVNSQASSVCAVKVHFDPDDAMEVVGDSGAYYVNDTANTIFRHYRYDCGATSGDARGMYLRLALTGAGGGGEAARIFTTVDDVAGATARGAHISLNFDESGSLTGLGVAADATLHVPDAAMTGGTYAAISADIHADGDESDPDAVTSISFLRVSMQGDATGQDAVDDKANFIDFDGMDIGAGNMIFANAATCSHVVRCDINGTPYYLMMANAGNLA